MTETAVPVPAEALNEERPLNLPFAYAKLNGVLVERDQRGPLVVYQGEPGIQVLTELRRFLGGPFHLQQLDDADFKRRLTLAYQRDNN